MTKMPHLAFLSTRRALLFVRRNALPQTRARCFWITAAYLTRHIKFACVCALCSAWAKLIVRESAPPCEQTPRQPCATRKPNSCFLFCVSRFRLFNLCVMCIFYAALHIVRQALQTSHPQPACLAATDVSGQLKWQLVKLHPALKM